MCSLHHLHPYWSAYRIAKELRDSPDNEIKHRSLHTLNAMVKRMNDRMDQSGAIVHRRGAGRPRTVTSDENKARLMEYCKNQRVHRACSVPVSKILEISVRSVYGKGL